MFLFETVLASPFSFTPRPPSFKETPYNQSLSRWRKLANQRKLIDCVFLDSVLLGNLVLVAKAWVDYLRLPANRPEQVALCARIQFTFSGRLPFVTSADSHLRNVSISRHMNNFVSIYTMH